jgi:hypothetical protein
MWILMPFPYFNKNATCSKDGNISSLMCQDLVYIAKLFIEIMYCRSLNSCDGLT